MIISLIHPHISKSVCYSSHHISNVYLYFILNASRLVMTIKSRKENPQKLTQLSSRSHPRHLVGKSPAQKDTIIDITSDSQVNSNFPYRWSPASLTFNNYFYLFLAHLSTKCSWWAIVISLCPSSVVRALSTLCFKRLLLQNSSTDFEIILQEGSLGDPLPKLLKPFRSVEQDGCQS